MLIGNHIMNKLPRKIFCFWFGDEMSKNRQKCFNSIIETSCVDVILITEKNLENFILADYPLHLGFNFLSSVHKSDYLRSYFMYFYGGGYTDIKMNNHDWNPYFDQLDKSDKDFLGCKETRPEYTALPHLKEYYNLLVSPGKYIFKKNTFFGNQWHKKTQEKMNSIYDSLVLNPGLYHPRAEFGGVQGEKGNFKKSKYPLAWNELLGQLFHQLQFENQTRFLKNLPPCAEGEYL